MSGAEPSARDLAQVLEYLDGRLSEDEMLDFEQRLEREPRLREVLEQSERDDELFRRHATRRAPEEIAPRAAAPLRRLPRRWIALAAASLAVAAGVWVVLRALSGGRGSALELQVAALETRAHPGELNERLGLAPDWLPEDLGRTRGQEPTGDEPSAAEYVAALRDRLAAQAAASMAATPPAIEAQRFVLVVRPSADCAALLIAQRPDGTLERLFPRPSVPPLDEDREQRDLRHSWLRAGSEVTLPAPVVELTAELRFDPGFVGPRDGPLRVLLALRRTPLDAALLAELDTWLARRADAGDTLADLERWLDEHGFDLR